MVGKKVVRVVLLLMVLALTAIPLNGFALPVNKDIAGDPKAVLADIEAMNLPDMPQELADQLRGAPLAIGSVTPSKTWLVLYGPQAWNLANTYHNLVSSFYKSLPSGTPVYIGTVQSTPAYFKK